MTTKKKIMKCPTGAQHLFNILAAIETSGTRRLNTWAKQKEEVRRIIDLIYTEGKEAKK